MNCILASFFFVVGWGSVIVHGIATWSCFSSIPPAAETWACCEHDCWEIWMQQHWSKMQCQRCLYVQVQFLTSTRQKSVSSIYVFSLGQRSSCKLLWCYMCIDTPVTASGLGAYFLDGNSFLNKLCEYCYEPEREREGSTKVIAIMLIICRWAWPTPAVPPASYCRDRNQPLTVEVVLP